MVVGLLKTIAYLISKPLWFLLFHGRQNIPYASQGALIIAANHQTYIDPVWISIAVKRPLRYMAFDQGFDWRVIGPLIRYLGAFPVATDGARARRSMRNALDALAEGSALVVFPEGARELADGKLLPFKTGVVRLALKAGVPIIPVTIRGGNRIWPQRQTYPRIFRRAEIIFHPPLQFEPGDADFEGMTEKLKEIIGAG